MPTRTVVERIRELEHRIRAWQTIDALLDCLDAAAPGRGTMTRKDEHAMAPTRPADDQSVLRSQLGNAAPLNPEDRGVQGCACPSCYNEVLTDGELGIVYVFCRRCYRAGCGVAGRPRHTGPSCTMPDCPHTDHY